MTLPPRAGEDSAARSAQSTPLRRYSQRSLRALVIARRVILGTWNDGFIHAGNLAYMTIFAIFPFFITASAVFSAIGEKSEQDASIDALLAGLPQNVALTIKPVAFEVMNARSGWLLWLGALVGLWTAGSLIETIRDILRRAYRCPPTTAFWGRRLGATGITVVAIIVLMASLIAQFAASAIRQAILAYFPQFNEIIGHLQFSQGLTLLGFYSAIYLLFRTLAPAEYRRGRFPQWPGALATTLWSAMVALSLPPLMRSVFTYSLTYGALSGIMIALFFFWLIGLGVVIGAELNAAIAAVARGSGKKAGGKRANEPQAD